MKLKNKKWVTLSIIVGVALLATTALADNISKTPYEQLKDAVKTTSSVMAGSEIESYTTVTRFSLKDNNTLLMEKISEQKSALGGSESESKEITKTASGSIMTSYSFNNGSKNIWYDSYGDIYYVTENQNYNEKMIYGNDMNYRGGYDPLAEEHIDDLERIFDALIGNLKNYVTVVKNDDGTLEFNGSLSDAQIPAVINAIASFLTKQFLTSVGGYENNMYDSRDVAMPKTAYELEKPEPVISETNNLNLPKLDGDVFIKSISGSAATDANGMITSVYADIVLSGKDENGNAHEVNFEIEIDVTDINSTELIEPDLTGKNVQINEFNPGEPQQRLTSKFEGTYKSDIITTIDGNFVKIGERFVVIEKIDETGVTGRYFEEYKEGYESETITSFDFSGENFDPYSVNFFYTDAKGITFDGQMYFDYNSATVQFYSNNGMDKFNSGFSRVFD